MKMQDIKNQKAELLISGDIPENSFNKIKKELLKENIELKKDLRQKNDKAIEIMPLIFRNLDAYAFLEKGALFSFFAKKTKKIFDIFAKYNDDENKLVWIIAVFEKWFDHTHHKDKKVIATASIYFNKENIEDLAEKLEKYLTIKFLNRLKERKLISIKWNTVKNKAIILVL